LHDLVLCAVFFLFILNSQTSLMLRVIPPKTCSIRPVVKTADLLLGFLQAGLAKLIGLAGDTNVQVDLPYSHSLPHSQAL
jgi:hypothetical protein